MSGLDLGLRAQAEAIASGQLDPAELLDACLERIEQRNPELNAVVETFPERSREMLAQAPRGPLYGVPVLIKDEWPLPWRAQRFGSAQMLSTPEPGESGPYLALRDAGAVIVGVGNMHELGMSSTGAISVYEPARNPWDIERCPGGSSSGPASAVASGLVAGAVGADGLGSIRYPGAYCGLTGLKPTFGRAAIAGHEIYNTETIVSGPLCRDAGDARLLASVLFGEEIPAGEAQPSRIGVVRDPLWEDCAAEVRERCEQGLDALVAETGSSVVELELPELGLWLTAALMVAQAEEAARLTPERVNSLRKEVSPIARGLMKLRAAIPATLPARSLLVRAQARRRLAAIFEQVDMLAWPTVPAVAPPLASPLVELPSSGVVSADVANGRHGTIANLTGIPGMSLPVGLSEGLPVGLQLLGSWQSDAALLDAAEALERATEREFVELRPAARA